MAALSGSQRTLAQGRLQAVFLGHCVGRYRTCAFVTLCLLVSAMFCHCACLNLCLSLSSHLLRISYDKDVIRSIVQPYVSEALLKPLVRPGTFKRSGTIVAGDMHPDLWELVSFANAVTPLTVRFP
jgi:hypothetical protein